MNVIEKDDKLYGFYSDIKDYASRAAYGPFSEKASAIYQDLMIEMRAYRNSPHILEISNNNGMGWTVTELKPQQ